MKRFLLLVSILLYIFLFAGKAWAQQTQTVLNGTSSAPINFPNSGCIYTWVNSTPSIGLAAGGTGNIASFTAVNNGTAPITATLTVTPVQSPGYAYITNGDDATVSEINIFTGQVIATVKVGATPIYVAASPDGNKVYVSNFYSNNVSVLGVPPDLSNTTINVGVNPAGLAVTPDGTELYVCNSTNVSVINTTTLQTVATIPMGQYPDFVTFSPDGSSAFVTNNYLNTVTVINTATNKISANFSAGTSPTGAVVTADGKYLYVANTYDNDVSVFNTANNSLFTTIPVGVGPVGIALSADGKTLYVVNSGDNSTSTLATGSVSVINVANNKITTTIGLGRTYPLGISLTPDGSRLYVVNNNTNQVTIINTATNAISGSIGVGQQPNSLGNFIAKAAPCNASTFQYTIIVNPTSNIITSTVSDGITTCSGSMGKSENIPDFSVSGTGLTGNITVNAPENFQIALTANGGYSGTVTLMPVNGKVSDTKIYLQATNSAPVGNISGNVVVISENAPSQDVAVYGVVGGQMSPSVSIVASANNICSSAPVTFTATPVNGGNSPVYHWKINANNAGTNSPAFTSSGLADGDNITCEMTSDAACAPPGSVTSNVITMNIGSEPRTPKIQIVTSMNNGCAGEPVTFTAIPSNGGNQPIYQWMVNGNFAGTNSPLFTISTLVTGDVVNCQLISDAACAVPATATSNSIIMNVNIAPTVNAGGNKAIAAGKSVVLNATVSADATDFTWSPATGLSNYKILNPVANPSVTTTYTLTVQTKYGCMASDVATVQVTYPIVIPNTFTPNGDGVNDTWNIKNLDTYTGCKVQIFNRWGQLLYSSTGYGIPWDGTYKGAAVPGGTYYYIINLNKTSKAMAGAVNVIR